MQFRIIAAGTRMPRWVTDAFQEYRKRPPRNLHLELVEIPLGQRNKKSDDSRAKTKESLRILEAVRQGERLIALDEHGDSWTTRQLAEKMGGWLNEGRDIAFAIGGPDGLGADCIERAESRWSVSSLTLPHAVVRVVLVEQLYRAWTVLNGHPYHRA